MAKLLLFFVLICAIQKNVAAQVDTAFQDVQEVFILSDKQKTIAFDDPKYFIVDFSVSETQTLLLMKNFGSYYVYSLDENMEFQHKLKLDVNANSLFDDCFGNTHIVTWDSIYFVLDDPFGLFITEAHPKRRMNNVLAKCAGMTSTKIIMEDRPYLTEDQIFYTIDLDSGYRKIIYKITDSTIAKSALEAEKLKEIESVYADTHPKVHTNQETEERKLSTEINLRAYLPGFLFRPKPRIEYNPMFVVGDTLFIFNHAEGRIDQLDDEGNLLHSIPVDYQLKNGWRETIYPDVTTKRFYAAWMKNGVQHLIGLAQNDDEQNFSTQITEHAYPEKVIIRNGYVYYLYKPNFDANLNKLYRQKL